MNKLVTSLFFVFILNPIFISCFSTQSFQQVSARSQLAQMLIQVQSKDINAKSITMVLKEIKKMLVDLQETQAKHAEINKQMIDKCIEEDTFRGRAVGEAKTSLDAATGSLAIIQDGIIKTKKSIIETQTNLDFNKTEKKRAEDQRIEERKIFEIFNQNWTAGLKFMREFETEVVSNFKNANLGTFAQLSEKFLIKASNLNVIAAAPAVLLSLKALQDHNVYSFSGNKDVAVGLKAAIEVVIERIRKDLEKVTERENNAQTAWEAYNNKLGDMITALETQLEELEAHLKVLLAGEVTEKSTIDLASNKLNRNGSLRSSAQGICENFNKEFIAATKDRLEEIDVIFQITDIIKRRMGQLPEGFEEYLVSTENGFKLYTNSTEFKKYLEYDRVVTENNLLGKALTAEENLVVIE
jgi:hypothetical protein